MSVSQNYSQISPSLSLDFANVKALDPRVTFARASGATYYGTQTAKAEENLLTYSQEFDSVGWAAPTGATISDNTAVSTAPDGTSTASLLTESATTSAHRIASASITLPAITHTISIFAKPNGRDWLIIRYGAVNRAWFDITNGVVGTSISGSNPVITAVGNGWYRCNVNIIGAGVASNVVYGISNADNEDSYTGNGTSGILLWGAQAEARSSLTAYTPTTDQPITRYQPVLESVTDNVARFDHDPVTGESLGLLVQEQRTNLVLYSEDFTNAAWSKNRTIITANATTAPDGTLTADKLINNTEEIAHYIIQNVAKSASATTYTFSTYAKKAELSECFLLVGDFADVGNRASVLFDLTNGAQSDLLVVGTFTNASASSEDVGGGFYRVSLTVTSSTETSLQARIANGPLLNTAGDGYSGIYIWGASIEEGKFQTSYVKTEASQVTRSADSASMTGANFSSWYRQDEGTVYSESFSPADSITGIFNHNWTLTQDVNNYIAFISSAPFGSSGNNLSVRVNSISQLSIIIGLKNEYNKVVLSIATNDSNGAANGGLVQSDTDCLLPAPNSLHLGGSGFSAGNTRSTHIKKFAFYPKALTNTQLQALTG